MNQNTIKHISNRSELIAYLSQEGNSYSNFIIDRINRDPMTLVGVKKQSHHIIPLHMKGPNVLWNLIPLTLDEHRQAHQLLYENYKKLADLGATQMLSGQLKLGADTIRKMANEKMKNEKKGFFSSSTQSELALRPKKPRKPNARNVYVAAALSRGFSLQYIPTLEVVRIEPFECPSVVFVINKLMLYPQMKEKRTSWNR